MTTTKLSVRLLVAGAILALPVLGNSETPRPVKPSAPTTAALPSVADLVDRVGSTVVNIEVVGKRQVELDPRMERELERFFGEIPEGLRPQIQRGAGSGIIIDGRGRILTNSHVVEGATSIRVRLVDGRELDARVLGRDPLTDIALLQIESPPKDLEFAVLGDSSATRVGDPVIAIGNPFGLESSVSLGVLSGRARQIGAGPYDDFLQTDAAINPGNSGGPLFNANGEVIGINTAIAGIGTGVGFAIPSNLAKQVLEPLAKGEDVRRGWIGVAIQDVTPDLAEALGVEARHGAAVADVERGSPGEKAGLQPEDIIVEVDGEEIESASDLTRMIGFMPPKKRVELTVLREGKTTEIPLTLGTRPDLEQIRPVRGEDEDDGPDTGPIGLTLRDAGPRISGDVPGEGGAVVTGVQPGSAAEEAGLREGMVIFEADGRPVKSAADLGRRINRAKPDTVFLLRAQLEGRRVLAPLRIPERTSE